MNLPSLIGDIHLPPLAGSPGSYEEHPASALQKAGLQAVREARALEQAGFDGLILENFGDVPFYKDRVPPETVASMAVIAAAVREATKLPIGINILRNDARAALAVAATTGCNFIRVNVLSGVAATDQGIVEGQAAELLRERDRLGAKVAILADAHVKHAKTLSSDDLLLAIEDLALRSSADGVILTGTTTGRPVDVLALSEASRFARSKGIRLFIGSGATRETVGELKTQVHGIIVGSDLRKSGKAGAPLDAVRVRDFVKAYRLGVKKGKASRKSRSQSKR
jgi:membrane complex biogenesis BtpA family protein